MTDHIARPAARALLKRKSAIVTVALQCLPLLFPGAVWMLSGGRLQSLPTLVHESVNTAGGSSWEVVNRVLQSLPAPVLGSVNLTALLLLAGFLMWGFGYAYLGLPKRFLLALVFGLVWYWGPVGWRGDFSPVARRTWPPASSSLLSCSHCRPSLATADRF